MKIVYLTIVTLMLTSIISGKAQTISGKVNDENGEPLIGAHVYTPDDQRGDVTNAAGYYAISLGAGKKQLIFSYVGFESDTISFDLRSDTLFNIRLKSQQIETVVVSAARENNVASNTQLGVVRLSLAQVKKLPSLAGEVDIIKALSFTPGVSNGNEGSAGLYVRGGSPDQNLILLDGAVVYNPNHLFGFLSVFNADAIKDVSLIKGNYPARYGGRLSSVLDISMKEGNAEQWKGELGMGLLSSRITLEGPLVKNKISFLASGRSSYLGLLLWPLRAGYNRGERDNHLNYFMTDFNVKINIKISDREQINLSAYTGNDKLQLFTQTYPIESSTSSIGWGNLTTTLRHHKALGSGTFWETTAGITHFLYNFNQKSVLQQDDLVTRSSAQYSSGLNDYFLNTRLTFPWQKNHKIQLGLETIRHHFMPQNGIFSYQDAEGNIEQQRKESIWGTAMAAYAEDEWAVSGKLSATLGLRWSSMWIDGRFFKAWEPRAGIRYNLDRYTALKIGYGQTQQYIHLLASSSLGLQNDVWAPSTTQAPPQRARQWAAGFAHYLHRWDTDFSFELFYKTMDNLIDFGEGVNLQLSVTAQWEDLIENQGEGYAYGLEMFLHKRTGRLNGMMAYTYARSMRQFSEINNGQIFPFKYDAPHQFSTAANWQLNRKWDISLTWTLRSGYPVSIPEAIVAAPPSGFSYYGQAAPIFIYGKRSNYRLPAYHRADIALNNTKTNRWGKKQTWSFSIYNLYNRQNVLYAHLTTKYLGRDSQGNFLIKPVLETRYLLPILPSISYAIRF